MFLPHLAHVEVDRVAHADGAVVIEARTLAATASCPACQWLSTRIHSRYTRQLGEAAVAAKPTRLLVEVRKFFCNNASCQRRIFTERLGFAGRYARRTAIAQNSATSVALALGGRAGARLTGVLGIGTSRTTLLRLVRRIPELPVGQMSTWH